jgi:hypothetical protein
LLESHKLGIEQFFKSFIRNSGSVHVHMGFKKIKFGLAYLGIIRWRSSLANAEFMSRHLYKADFAPALLTKSARLRAVSVPNVRSEADFRLERLQAQRAGEG